MIFQVDDFTSQNCLVLLAAVILGFKHFLLSLFECRFFFCEFLQALSAQAMVQGLLALPRKSDSQTRAAQLFTVFSQLTYIVYLTYCHN